MNAKSWFSSPDDDDAAIQFAPEIRLKTYCLALDLKNDLQLIDEYKQYHQPENLWPEVAAHLKQNGVLRQQIFLLGTRMVMVLSTSDEFSFEERTAADLASPAMQRWEALMNKFQERLPQASPGQKWVPMESIFDI